MAFFPVVLLIQGALLPALCVGQDLQIYGKFNSYINKVDSKELSFITTKCFQGLLFSTCRPTNVPDDYFGQSVLLPYYIKFSKVYGALYCLECCGSGPDQIDHWNLACDMDSITAVQSNVYGYELRLAARQYDGDKSLVTCPLRRSACAYSGNTVLNCDGQVGDTTYLTGYTLTINVQELDENFVYWRGVTSCDIQAVESSTPLQAGDIFRETIIMIHTPQISNSRPDAGKVLLSLLAFYFFAYVALYYFRRKRCVYCQGKLVFSKELCVRCKFVGAKPPDPFLLQALEEKGEHIQGDLPDRLPGSRDFVKRLVNWWRGVEDYLGLHANCKVQPGGAALEASAATVAEEKEGAASRTGRIKYPKWLKWLKKWRARRQQRLKDEAINPNILSFPKHVIFGAVGHHDPPPPSEECVAARKQTIAEELGYNPEDYADHQAGGLPGGGEIESEVDHDDESKSPEAKAAVPAWQKVLSKPSVTESNVPAVSYRLRQQLRRGFTKVRNRGPPIIWRFVLPFCCGVTCLTAVLVVVILAVFEIVNFGDISFHN